jgi:hypothetical protein
MRETDLKSNLIKLEAITQELNRRQRENGILYYTPNAVQLRAHKSKARIIAYCGSNRSGKSTLGAVELAWHITKKYPEWFPKERRFWGSIKAVIVATEYPVVERVIEPKIMSFLPKDSIARIKRTPQGYLSRIFCKDSSTIDILTNEMDTMAFESADWDFYWGDEPQREDKYIAIMRGLTDRIGRGVLTFTPLVEPWMKEKICDVSDGKRYELFIADIRDNKFDIKGNPILSEEAIQEFEATMDDEMKETRIHGRFFHLKGIVYKEFSSVHILTFDYKYPDPVTCVIDPHDRLPHHCIWAFTDRTGDVFVHDELIMQGDLRELSISSRAREHLRSYFMHKRLLDPNFGAKPSSVGGVQTVQQELSNPGYNLKCTLANDDRETGHLKVKEYLHFDIHRAIDATNKPKLFFHPQCVKTIHSLKNYQYDDYKDKTRDPKELPKPKDNHGADCVRYLIMDNPSFYSMWSYEPSMEGVYV